MRKALLFPLMLVLVSLADLRAQSPIVQQIINSVNIDTMMCVLRELTGEDSTLINGTYQKILSRHALDPGNALAEAYLEQKLESYGFTVAIQSHSASGRSVLATQPGTLWPNRKFIICAHFDSMPEGPISPAADDNGTGVAIVLEAARILGKHSFPCTIIYALWDEEEFEPYLQGSMYYARNARAVGDSIIGVINLDMPGYDGDGDGYCMVQGPDNVHYVQLRHRANEVNSLYGIGLHVVIEPPWLDSDCGSFQIHGYDAMHLAEYSWIDRNPYFHTVDERVNALNQPYVSKMTKLALGTLAFHALALNLDLIHLPLPAVVPRGAVTANASVYTGLQVGDGSLAPRLYYRTKTLGGTYGSFSEVVGTSGEGGTYDFNLPEFPDFTYVQYYLAAQDENSTSLSTSPVGGSGFNPPGNVPPGSFHEFVVGSLAPRWSDDENDLTNWTATGGWGTTTAKYLSEPTSFTESPSGNTPPYLTALLTCNTTMPADTAGRTFLEFKTQWAFQNGADNAQVQISTNNGSTWQGVKGQYTYMGRAYPTPKAGLVPIYGGVQSTWVHEIINISAYTSKAFKFRFRVRTDNSFSLDGWYIDDVRISTLMGTTMIGEEIAENVPVRTSLSQNYPNPFNPNTTVGYTVGGTRGQASGGRDVRLGVYDILGREVAVLVNEKKAPGTYEVKFDASGLASGLYFYRLTAGTYVETRKMILVR